MNETDHFWDDCELVQRDPEVVSGAPVLKGTRLPADTLISNFESFIELEAMGEHEAIDATLEAFPGIPGGKTTLRALLNYQASHIIQLSLEDRSRRGCARASCWLPDRT